MTEREELELAALAAGIDRFDFAFNEQDEIICEDGWFTLAYDKGRWSPKHDDGDSFRLMNALNMDVFIAGASGMVVVSAFAVKGHWVRIREDSCNHNNDRNAATREAIFRVAVEVGRRMKAVKGSEGK